MNKLLEPLYEMDQRSFFYVFNLSCHYHVVTLARLISRFGDGYLYAILGLIVFKLDAVQGERFLIDGLLAFSIELPLYLVLKNSIRRPRPSQSTSGFLARHKASDEFSFPSGHTAAAFLFATLMSFYYPKYFVVFYLLAGLVGFSRVMLGVHYPSDIAAGILLGCGATLTVLLV